MSMWWDLSLQALIFLVSIAAYLWTNNIPQKLFTQYHSYRNRHKHQARRHFVRAAEHLSSSQPSSAVTEADAAIQLDPTDAASHILKAVALEVQGFNTSALDSLNVALSPLAVKSLEVEEKADAMAKRAQLRMAVAPNDQEVWRVAEKELREVVELKKESVRAWCLLGKCCEGIGKNEAAKEAYEEAVRIAPNSAPAKEGLQRLEGDN
ncbi:hypothetical protein RDABS01_008991 [Bienertia sinuspersici]